MDAAEFYPLWETSLGRRELAAGEHSANPRKMALPGGTGKVSWMEEVCSLAVEVLPYTQHPATVSY